MATHSNVLAWRIPKTEEPGGLKRGTRLNDFYSLRRLHAFISISSLI